jgi:acetylornithine deacetylase
MINDEQKKQLIEKIDSLKDNAADLCSRLVQQNTVNPYGGKITGNENNGQKVLKPELEALGFKTVMFEPPEDVYKQAGVLAPKGRTHKGRNNLVGTLSLPNPGKTIVINGHMDTVGIDEMSIEPFSGEIKDGKVWGRGTCDCKGSLVGGFIAVKALVEAGLLSKGKLIFESVIDEECSGVGAGTISCCLAGYNGDMAILTDGSVEYIATGCLGLLTGVIKVVGQGGHASQRGLISALDMALLIKSDLDAFAEEYLAENELHSFCLGQFEAGDAPWSVPSKAVMKFNVSYTHEFAKKNEREHGVYNGLSLRKRIEEIVKDSVKHHKWLQEHPPALSWDKDAPPHFTGSDAEVTHKMSKAYKDITDTEPIVKTMPGWHDGGWLRRLGNMPTATLGASRPGRAHSPDEWVGIDDMILQAKVIALALADLL